MSARRRSKTVGVARVVYDPDRTPRESGTFGVMQTACEQAIDRLVSWGDARLLSPHKDLRDAASVALALAEQFSEHLKFVHSWQESPPSDGAKSKAINDIMSLREQAMNMLQRFGANL